MKVRSSSGSLSSSQSEEELPLYNFDHGAGAWPIWSSKPQSIFMRYRRTHPHITFFGSAAVLGSLFFVLSSSLGQVVFPGSTSSQVPYSFKPASLLAQPNALEHTGFFDVTPGGIPNHLIDYSLIEPEDVSAMLSKTEGFYARDYSLHLGWNNVRATL